MTRSSTLAFLALAAAATMVMFDPLAAARGWRMAFLTAGAPVFGAVLMLLIGRVTGGRWLTFHFQASATPVMLMFAVLILPAQFATSVPAHLAVWASPWLILTRTILACAGLWFVAARLNSKSLTFAAAALAFYAVFVSVIAYDWMLGGSLSHPVSSIGMILTAEQVGGACAGLLVLRLGSPALRRDMSYMLIAAALGLSYMIFMDYLIKWYADLPSEVSWYVARSGSMAWLATAALVTGLFGPIISLTFLRAETGRRIAGGSALIGLALANWWLVGGSLLAALAGTFLLIAMASFALFWSERAGRGAVHG